jgi:hypothetical protein
MFSPLSARFSSSPLARRAHLSALAISCMLCSNALATDWIVSPGESIQAAIAGASDGDRILVQPGTYTEVMDLLGKRLEVIGVGGFQVTVIDGTGLNNTLFYVANGEPTGTRISGFTLTGGAGLPLPSSWGFDYYGGAVHANAGSQLQVDNCLITRNGLGTGTFAGGIYSGGRSTGGTPTHVDVLVCEISDNEAWASGGATLVDWYGTMLLDRCTVVGNRSNAFFGQQGGISMANYGLVWVQNSIVWGNQGVQIGPFGPPYDKGTKATVTYCDVQNGFTGTGNLNADPQFVNPGAGDYTLSPTSPCIDAGDPASPPDCDGSRVDMGSYGPDCGIDCNGNGIDDSFEISGDPSLDWNGDGVLDECSTANYCTANPNTTGNGAVMSLSGSPVILDNDFTMTASLMPMGELGYFLMASSQGFLPGAGGTAGNLCLGFPVYRFNKAPKGQVLNSGSGGAFSFSPDLNNLPQRVVFVPGSSWFFQAWFRDSAASTSNFTDGIEVMFR